MLTIRKAGYRLWYILYNGRYVDNTPTRKEASKVVAKLKRSGLIFN